MHVIWESRLRVFGMVRRASKASPDRYPLLAHLSGVLHYSVLEALCLEGGEHHQREIDTLWIQHPFSVRNRAYVLSHWFSKYYTYRQNFPWGKPEPTYLSSTVSNAE